MNPPSVPYPQTDQSGLSPSRRLAVTTVSSSVLFRDSREVLIRHDGQDYRLRITRHNKLILTK